VRKGRSEEREKGEERRERAEQSKAKRVVLA
jgi:hypothetical protein